MRRILRLATCTWAASLLFAGCGQQQPAPKAESQAETKPAPPAVPEEIQEAANAFLGTETEVLAYGDLAKNGRQEFLAVNRPPKPPKGAPPGNLITRAIIAENADGKWAEVFRCDEHLKNPNGYLGLTPLDPVTGWRMQYEQDAEKGLQLYFTPLQVAGASHVLPIGVRWNPAMKRYQSVDRNYQNFLNEVRALDTARSTLR